MITIHKTKILTILFIAITLSFMLFSPSQSLAAGNKSTSILLTAKKLVGIPYRYGGMTPRGFDCSGFVNYVYKKHGISLSRSSKTMWGHGGKRVKSLKPGDLLFFKTNGHTVSHVGIYLGKGKFIHSAQRGVKIDILAARYYRHTYLGAKRFL